MKEQRTKSPAGNSTYKKLTVHWLNGILYFMSSFVLAEVWCFEIANFL